MNYTVETVTINASSHSSSHHYTSTVKAVSFTSKSQGLIDRFMTASYL